MSATEAGQIVSEFSCEIAQLEDYRFEVRFDKPGHPALYTDEPAPLGKDTGPIPRAFSPRRLVTASVPACYFVRARLGLRSDQSGRGSRPGLHAITRTGCVSMTSRCRLIPALTRVNSHDVCRSLKTTVSSRKAYARASKSRWRSSGNLRVRLVQVASSAGAEKRSIPRRLQAPGTGRRGGVSLAHLLVRRESGDRNG